MDDTISTYADLAEAIDGASEGDEITVQSLEGLGCEVSDGVGLIRAAQAKGVSLKVLEGLASIPVGPRPSDQAYDFLRVGMAFTFGEAYGYVSPEDVRRLRAERDALAAEVADLRNQLNNDQAAA